VPLLGEAVTLAGPIKGVTLNVATARFSVHGSREVVFRRGNVSNLAAMWGSSPFSLVISLHQGFIEDLDGRAPTST